jgi:hypothetical protein
MDKKYIIEMANVIAKATPAAIDLKIPDGITEIKDYAYWNGTDLRTISISASVTKIGAYAFAGCVGLQRFFVDPGNRHFCTDELGVLYNKEKTELIAYPAALQPKPEKDVNGTFWSQYYDIPEGVIRIAPGACIGSRKVAEFILPDSLIEIGDYAFAASEIQGDVYIKSKVSSIGEGVFDLCPLMGPIRVDKDNQSFCSVWGGLSTKDETRLIRISEGQSGELRISQNLKTIDDGAFADCAELEEVICPKALVPRVRKALKQCAKQPKLTEC